MLTKVRATLRASRSYLGALVRPNDPVKRRTEQGHDVLEGWGHSPEEALLSQMDRIQRERQKGRRFVLFGISGPHQGELFLLKEGNLTLGQELRNSLVITPDKNFTPVRYQMYVNGEVRLQAPPGEYFVLNGKQEQQGHLLDFDQVDLFGNRFLFLESPEEMPELGRAYS